MFLSVISVKPRGEVRISTNLVQVAPQRCRGHGCGLLLRRTVYLPGPCRECWLYVRRRGSLRGMLMPGTPGHCLIATQSQYSSGSKCSPLYCKHCSTEEGGLLVLATVWVLPRRQETRCTRSPSCSSTCHDDVHCCWVCATLPCVSSPGLEGDRLRQGAVRSPTKGQVLSWPLSSCACGPMLLCRQWSVASSKLALIMSMDGVP